MNVYWVGMIMFALLSGCATTQDSESRWQPVYVPGILSDGPVLMHGFSIVTQPKNQEVKGPADLTLGQTIYRNHCQKCHGAKGHGDGPLAQKMKLQPANLSQVLSASNNRQFFYIVQKGRTDMPTWKNVLTEAEIRAVYGHIKSLNSSNQ